VSHSARSDLRPGRGAEGGPRSGGGLAGRHSYPRQPTGCHGAWVGRTRGARWRRAQGAPWLSERTTAIRVASSLAPCRRRAALVSKPWDHDPSSWSREFEVSAVTGHVGGGRGASTRPGFAKPAAPLELNGLLATDSVPAMLAEATETCGATCYRLPFRGPCRESSRGAARAHRRTWSGRRGQPCPPTSRIPATPADASARRSACWAR
jgi:hypothetical protein